MNLINSFNSNFYFKYKLPKFDVLLERLAEVEDTIEADNIRSWGNLCSLTTISEDQMSRINFSDIITEAIDLLSVDLKSELRYSVFHPWMNHYKKGDHQEPHIHDNCDLAGVIFLNQGEDFGKFYFLDSNAATVSKPWVPILSNLTGRDPVFIPEGIEAGDIIFFPTHMFHGVSTHRSDTVRKSIAFNILIEGCRPISDENIEPVPNSSIQ